ncbi:MAG: undecaprenyl-phosphate glucose phosphotransferase [Undibacterium sp.]|nr:undecaprenyl-phosphate glucose phosphotransferase [Undibacterium sp.]
MHDLIGKNSTTLELLMRAIDVITLIFAGGLASAIHFKISIDQVSQIHSTLLYLCSFLSFIVFEKMGIYRSWRGRRPSRMIGNIAISWALALLMGLLFSFLIHRSGDVSRLWLFYWFLVGTTSVVTVRWLIHSVLRHIRKNGLNKKRVVIVGYGPVGQEMHRRAKTQNWYGYDVIAIYTEDKHLDRARSDQVKILTSLDELPTFVDQNHIDEIWIALSVNVSAQSEKLQYLLRNALIDIRWIPDTFSIRMLSSDMGDFLGFPTVDLNRPISSGFHGMAKDVFDKLFALTVLILLLPLFSVIAICIKNDSPGPIFFKQFRHGLNGKLFSVYKFRTMKLHEEKNGLTQAKKNDDRITAFGKFMRRTSLDELPQFVNVLFGDMSIVGPRPHALQHNDLYKDQIDLYMLRHRVKPGITGWAQIHGFRGETDTLDKMAERVQFDLYYIRNWSFWMDVRIIAWTALKGWTGNNAY